MMVTLNRGDYWQCAYVIPKGGIETVKREGLAGVPRRASSELEPFLKDRVDELKSFDDIKLLTVAIDRLRQWHRPGLLCIGDAAHAMSPVGGVGVNLAVQDAVAAANILAEPLRAGAVTREHLAAVQARRAFPMRVIQRMQVIVQNKLLSPALNEPRAAEAAVRDAADPVVSVLRRFRRGCRPWRAPEHIQTPDFVSGRAGVRPEAHRYCSGSDRPSRRRNDRGCG